MASSAIRWRRVVAAAADAPDFRRRSSVSCFASAALIGANRLAAASRKRDRSSVATELPTNSARQTEASPATGGGLLSDPLEVLEALRRVREDVDGVLERQRPDLGQPASDLCAKVERTRRQLMNQQEPTRNADTTLTIASATYVATAISSSRPGGTDVE